MHNTNRDEERRVQVLGNRWLRNCVRWEPLRRCGFRWLTLAGVVGSLISADAATLPSGFAESTIASGLSSPTAMEFAPDGRLFVCQQGGQLRVIKNGALLPAPFLSVTVSNSGERGLLGVAFDPNFATNQYVYVYYTATTPAIHNRVSRFTANGDTAVAGSEVIILDLNNLSSATNHNGGAIHFGADGKLYIAVGENANSANAQTLGNLLGKMLRINADGSIPTNNPYYNTATGVNRAIWALGLRNPFTFAVQPGTGRIFINDVGEGTWEEINEAVVGANYGWPSCEGNCGHPSYRDSIFRYAHGSGATTGNAITGGTFYNPGTVQFPASYVGKYFFADYTSGWIRMLDPANGNQVTGFATGISSPVDLKTGPDGRLYYLARGSSAVRAIQYTASGAPQITQQPTDQTVQAGQPATFTVGSTGTTSHQWQRNGANIAGATSASYTLAAASLADDGAAFRCVLSNSSGTTTSNAAVLHVTSNTPPTGTITTPGSGALYSAGETIQFSGTANDAEDGALAASRFSWTIIFHHDTHTHPFAGPFNGVTGGSFTVPTQGETAANVWYRIHLVVTDSGGQTHSSFRDILPRTATVSLATSPAGLQVTLDGQPVTTPVSTASVVGNSRTLGVVSPQQSGGTTYEFESWSDGGAATHTISSPATNTTYTATYRVVPPGTGPATFANAAPITIPDVGAGTPYPSTINVSGLSGTITAVTLTLKNLNQTYADDVDILLVGPGGQKAMVFSDVGGSNALNNVTVTLADAAASALPDSAAIASGTYRPTDASPGEARDAFAAPAPGGPYGSSLGVFNGLSPNGTWSLYVNDDGAGDSGSIAGGWSLTFYGTTGAPLPSPWQTADIGNVGAAGSASHSGGTFTVTGAGNISSTADSFRFVHQVLSGDGEIMARINSMDNTGTSGRIGVMIRESLTGNARNAFMGIRPDGTFRSQQRATTGGTTSSTNATIGSPPNTWVRLVRTGGTLYGYRSTDGVDWTLVNSYNITMAANIYLGLAVASGSSGTLNTATLSNVSVVP